MTDRSGFDDRRLELEQLLIDLHMNRIGDEDRMALESMIENDPELGALSDRVGSLKPGADGNLVLYSGDPLSITSFVEHVVIEGRDVYDRSKDVRSRLLLEGVQPDNTAAEPENGEVRR